MYACMYTYIIRILSGAKGHGKGKARLGCPGEPTGQGSKLPGGTLAFVRH